MKSGNKDVLQVNTHRMTESDLRLTSRFQDSGHDVISHRKVLPPNSSWSIVHSYLFHVIKYTVFSM